MSLSLRQASSDAGLQRRARRLQARAPDGWPAGAGRERSRPGPSSACATPMARCHQWSGGSVTTRRDHRRRRQRAERAPRRSRRRCLGCRAGADRRAAHGRDRARATRRTRAPRARRFLHLQRAPHRAPASRAKYDTTGMEDTRRFHFRTVLDTLTGGTAGNLVERHWLANTLVRLDVVAVTGRACER